MYPSIKQSAVLVSGEIAQYPGVIEIGWDDHFHMNATFTCLDVGDAACQPGCQCPDGYVIHNGECIPPQNCSEMCLYNGVVYDVRGITCIDCFVKFRFVIKFCLIV